MATLAEIGQTLKEAREAQGLSLDELAARTRIARRHLAAIEEGDESDLPEIFYVRGFLKKYAEVVGLSPTDIADAYHKAPAQTPPPPKPEVSVGPIVYYVLIIGAILGALALAWYFQPHLSVVSEPSPTPTPSPTAVPSHAPALIGPTQSAPASPAATGSPSEENAGTSPAPTEAGESPLAASPAESAPATSAPSPKPSAKPSAPSPTPSVPASPKATPKASASISLLRVQLTAPSWVQIKADGKVVYTGLAPKGMVKEFSGSHFEVRAGNAGGVEVSLNGESQGAMGATGAVVNRTF